MVRKLAWASVALLALVSLALAATALLQQGNTYSIDFDDPNHDGTQTITVTVSYTDPQGVKKEKKVAATTTIAHTMTAITKKEAVQAALDAALALPANQVGGQSLATTGGIAGQDVMQVAPATATGNPPPFTEAKITKITTDDKNTKENDKVTPPGQSPAVATVSATGDLTGQAASGPASFSVITNQGLVSVTVTAGMRRLTLLQQLRSGLLAQGAKAWVDSDRMLLHVLIDGDVISGVGAGTNDSGLAAVSEVMSM
ncbi:MAG: hypothetical protein IPJ19_00020 [Planctomycetes bacterium]|nr:hypothetical protein [Planctomycetota bacterium]